MSAAKGKLKICYEEKGSTERSNEKMAPAVRSLKLSALNGDVASILVKIIGNNN